MMQLYGALILCVTLSAACGLKCYTCTATDPKSCTNIESCSSLFNRCSSVSAELNGVTMVTKGCLNSLACISPITCCEGDLCNSAIPTGPSAILLLVSSAILKLLF
ncbi:prostate stem cell antigen-like isoform X1 [Archocentrus centrarchus]|uniref:prostate stem cell antigen-like isoform X1 n=1 Tax=Archocentrus centrarchus TaxID=63155 RepID=UPI0011EA2032|nr:prostate stem cell antigen-like isoform X1 [Archocentrus centrarchus]